MKIIEFQSTVDEKGRLIVPQTAPARSELTAGDRYSSPAPLAVPVQGAALLRICPYCAVQGLRNNEPELTLPHELLEAAEIPVDSDLEIICGSGAVVILESDLLEDLPDDLRELFDELGIRPEVVREVMRKGAMSDGC